MDGDLQILGNGIEKGEKMDLWAQGGGLKTLCPQRGLRCSVEVGNQMVAPSPHRLVTQQIHTPAFTVPPLLEPWHYTLL